MRFSLVLAVVALASVARGQSPRLTSDDAPPTAALPPVAPPAAPVAPVSDDDKYRAAYNRVKDGKAYILVVGPRVYPTEYENYVYVGSGYKGLADGEYDFQRGDDGTPSLRLRTAWEPAPAAGGRMTVSAYGQSVAVSACAPMASAAACGQAAADASACSGGAFERRQPVRTVVRTVVRRLFGGRLRGCQ